MDETQVKKIAQDTVDKYAEISNRKLGDTPTDAIQLTPKKYVDSQTSILASSIATIIASVASFVPTPFNIFGTGVDGTVTVSTNSTIARDMYYGNLTVSSNSTLNPSGYRIYVSSVLTINSGSRIARVGNNASVAVGGVALSAGSLPGALGGLNGSAGGNGRDAGSGGAAGVDGNPGLEGTSVLTSIGGPGTTNTSQHSGAGGNGSGFGGGAAAIGGVGGSVIAAVNPPYAFEGAMHLADMNTVFIQHNGSAGAGGAAGGGGGGGAGSATSAAGDGGIGGGAGGNGGMIAIYANTIINHATGGISVKGGDGGEGTNGANATGDGATQQGGGGGGCGGSGGTGGVIVLVYKTLTQNGTFDISGGTYGTFGTGGTGIGGGASASNGQLGTTGTPGVLWQYQV